VAVEDGATVEPGILAGLVDDDLLAVLQLRPDDRRTLARSGFLEFAYDETGTGADRRPTVVPAGRYALGSLPRVVMTPAYAREHGYELTPDEIVVIRSPHVLTPAQRNDVQDVVQQAQDDADLGGFGAEWYAPSSGVDPFLIDEILVGIALLLVLFVVAVNLALSAAETRDERDVLAVVGASPATTRRTNGYKATLVTMLGAVLALPVGFLPVVVFVTAHNHHELPLVFPWRLAAALVLVLPLIAGIVTTGGSALALRVRPVRVSKMAFD
jgi:hypothetical protein